MRRRRSVHAEVKLVTMHRIACRDGDNVSQQTTRVVDYVTKQEIRTCLYVLYSENVGETYSLASDSM